MQLVLAALLAAAPATGELPRVAVADFVSGATDNQTAQTFTRLVAAELARTGRFEVVSHDDLVAMAGMERWKQLVGCAAGTCLADAGALAELLQVRYLVAGSFGRTGGALVASAQMIDAARSRVSSRASRKVLSLDALGSDATALVAELLAENAVLQIFGQVAGGAVFVDDKPVAVMPASTIPLRLTGKHRLRAECSDCVPWESDVEFTPGRNTRVRLELEKFEDLESQARRRTAGGIAALVAGAGLAVGAIALRSDAASLHSQYLALDPLVASQAQFDDLSSRSRTRYALSYTLGTAGIIALAAGAWLLWSNPHSERLAQVGNQ